MGCFDRVADFADNLAECRIGKCGINVLTANHAKFTAARSTGAGGMPPGDFGTIVEVRVFNRHGVDKDERALTIEREEIELTVLARYMQVLSDDVSRRLAGRVINIHHSFLPAFVGSKPYHRAYERGVKLIGATVHYATSDLDEGPIIEQDVARASHRDSVQDLIRKGRDLEKLVLARAVRSHLEDRILIYSNKTVVFE